MLFEARDYTLATGIRTYSPRMKTRGCARQRSLDVALGSLSCSSPITSQVLGLFMLRLQGILCYPRITNNHTDRSGKLLPSHTLLHTAKPENQDAKDRRGIVNSLLELLLGAELVGVTALSLAAVGGTGGETSLCGCEVSSRIDTLHQVSKDQYVRSTCGRSSCRSCTCWQEP